MTPAASFRGSSKAGLFDDHVQELDSHIGEILSSLDELNLSNNTLVIFTSDNGSTPKDFKGTQGVRLNLADDSGDASRNKQPGRCCVEGCKTPEEVAKPAEIIAAED